MCSLSPSSRWSILGRSPGQLLRKEQPSVFLSFKSLTQWLKTKRQWNSPWRIFLTLWTLLLTVRTFGSCQVWTRMNKVKALDQGVPSSCKHATLLRLTPTPSPCRPLLPQIPDWASSLPLILSRRCLWALQSSTLSRRSRDLTISSKTSLLLESLADSSPQSKTETSCDTT